MFYVHLLSLIWHDMEVGSTWVKVTHNSVSGSIACSDDQTTTFFMITSGYLGQSSTGNTCERRKLSSARIWSPNLHMCGLGISSTQFSSDCLNIKAPRVYLVGNPLARLFATFTMFWSIYINVLGGVQSKCGPPPPILPILQVYHFRPCRINIVSRRLGPSGGWTFCLTYTSVLLACRLDYFQSPNGTEPSITRPYKTANCFYLLHSKCFMLDRLFWRCIHMCTLTYCPICIGGPM